VVGGIYLVPLDLSDPCADAARRLRFAVPCPTMTPFPAPGSAPPRCEVTSIALSNHPSCVVDDRAFLLELPGFGVPPELMLPPGFGPRLLIAAIRSPDTGLDAIVPCPHRELIGDTTVRPADAGTPRTALLIRCAGTAGRPEGFDMLRWWIGEVEYDVLARGQMDYNASLIGALADRLVLVRPEP
jgi:hypothetical protein